MAYVPKLQDFDDADVSLEVPDKLAYGDMVDPWSALYAAAKRNPVLEADFRTLVGLEPDPTYGDRRVFLAFDYETIRAAVSDNEHFGMSHHKDGLARTIGSQALVVLDPPEHTRYRRIFQKAFLPQAVAAWSEEFVEPVINELIDRFIDRGRCELMAEFVQPYPFEIIYRQLRLPRAEIDKFYRMTSSLTFFFVDMPLAREAHDKLGNFLQEMIDERRKNPGTDLISVLATTELDGEYLPDNVLRGFFRLLTAAAGDTTFRCTGCMLVGLLSDRPDQFERVKRDRSLVPKAVEETLRWEGPTSMSVRTVKKDVELHGVKIPAGSILQVIHGIANRNPAIFPGDRDPDQFDMMRGQLRPHVAFGAGPHMCLGQHLARLEMNRALNSLMDRLPNLRLDPDYPKPEIRGALMRRPRHLQVRFD
jgi:cytochrome P450